MRPLTIEPRHRRPVVLWLVSVCALIVAMVSVGGITRLTGSGLSMVEWKPIMGAIPPLTDADWRDAFARYQQYPQYRILNAAMTLGGFKVIFFWEYAHRLLGRLIGVAFLVPWLVFWRRGAFGRALALRLGGGFVLGGLQGALGWFMVKSGLVDMPRVSHYRLAAHLGLALVVLSYLFWIVLDLVDATGAAAASTSTGDRGVVAGTRAGLKAILGLLAIQITYGAFVAGLHAGYGYPTFPTMNGEWVPSAFFGLEPAWRNVFENPAAVQFIHRTIAWILVGAIIAIYVVGRRAPMSPRRRSSLDVLLAMVGIQFVLGVTTVLFSVPITVAALHQLGACVLLLALLRALHAFTRGMGAG